ncbi:MAG: ATP-binding protein [Peptococcaceae bacterium]|jgi:two-component system phosphate regulon sensor histidine kinase PhoR|nr:ATP-binding protein [Peptococcaceae bacterium]MDH7524329.1 ATP-binding protein [Peptococcaceae bacterium]
MSKLAIRVTSVYFIISIITLMTIVYMSRILEKGLFYVPALILIFLAGGAAFYLWFNKQAVHIRKLNEMAKAFAQGNLIPTGIVSTDDELGELNDSMCLMAKNLSEHLRKTLQEKDRMETILTSMVEGVLVFDCHGRLILMNRAAEDMLGVKFEDESKHFFLEILQNHQMADLLKRGLSESKRQVMEVRLSPMNNEYYRVYVTPILGKEGNSQGAVMVLRNVTKVRLLEQMRSNFVANVSHELRTPLTSIKGYVETLLDGALDNKETALHFLTVINTEADRLNRLIDDLLYLSQLETGRMEVAKKVIDSKTFLEKVVVLLQQVARSKNINIDTVVHPAAQTFLGNQDMMEQVMINLLENSIKYSHDGGSVSVEIFPHEQGTAIRVSDTGIGIPVESLPRIFERFYRVDKARSRQVGGTGLGLSIVKHVVDRHRGQVQVESEEDKGTTFTIILPKA